MIPMTAVAISELGGTALVASTTPSKASHPIQRV